MATVDKLGLRDDTLVMFTSDNGPHQEGGHKMEYFDSNGPLRGKKRDLYEGGVRVPGLFEWPARIPQPRVTQMPCNTSDIYPTLLEIAGPLQRVEGVIHVRAREVVPLEIGGAKMPASHDYR